MRKQDYHVFVVEDRNGSLEIRKLQNKKEVGIIVTELGVSSSSSLAGDYIDYKNVAEHFLTRDKAIEMINSLKEYFNIP